MYFAETVEKTIKTDLNKDFVPDLLLGETIIDEEFLITDKHYLGVYKDNRCRVVVVRGYIYYLAWVFGYVDKKWEAYAFTGEMHELSDSWKKENFLERIVAHDLDYFKTKKNFKYIIKK